MKVHDKTKVLAAARVAITRVDDGQPTTAEVTGQLLEQAPAFGANVKGGPIKLVSMHLCKLRDEEGWLESYPPKDVASSKRRWGFSDAGYTEIQKIEMAVQGQGDLFAALEEVMQAARATQQGRIMVRELAQEYPDDERFKKLQKAMDQQRTKRSPRKAIKAIEAQAYRRGKKCITYTCPGCGLTAPYLRHFVKDHVWPLYPDNPDAPHGVDGPENIAMLCWACNQTKGNRVLSYAELRQELQAQGLVLGRQFHNPTGIYLLSYQALNPTGLNSEGGGYPLPKREE